MSKHRPKRRRRAVNQGFVKSLAHELRVEILMILTERTASPNEIAKMLGEGLSQVSYHVKVLRDYGRIKLVRTEPVRGAMEHFYRATADTLLPAHVWRGAKGLRTVVGGGFASELFDDFAEAVAKKKLTEANSHVARIPLVLDTDGLKNVQKIVKRATGEIEKEQRASAKRVTKAKREAKVTEYIVGILAFENSEDALKGTAQGKATSSNGKAAKRSKGTRGKDQGTSSKRASSERKVATKDPKRSKPKSGNDAN